LPYFLTNIFVLWLKLKIEQRGIGIQGKKQLFGDKPLAGEPITKLLADVVSP